LSFLSHSPFTFWLEGVLRPEKNQKVMKKMRISIENPCHEDWQAMTPETQGRFCGACEKTVVDFTTMSDAEILQYFSKPDVGKTCGRFQ
jgi:predicted house-cleaning NTP pyrophosphatase (Maf/HAM1 superfamily)